MTDYTGWIYIKIWEKKNQLVDFWGTDEIAPSQISFWKYLEYVTLI